MCHLVHATTFLRWSVLRFRNHDGQLRYLTLPCRKPFPVLETAQRVVLSKLGGNCKQGLSRRASSAAGGPLFKHFYQGGGYHLIGFCLPATRGCRRHVTSCAAEGVAGGEAWSLDSTDDDEDEEEEGFAAGGEEYKVVNFYHFVEIEDPHQEVARHAAFMEVPPPQYAPRKLKHIHLAEPARVLSVPGRNIRGRIYINHQGINAQLSGPTEDAMAYANWVKEDERFSPIYIQVSPSPRGHAFPRLRLRYKPSLVQVCASGDLPLTDSSLRAVPLTPKQWREKLEERSLEMSSESNGGGGTDGPKNLKKVLVLDIRNGYEWDVGHFEGAARPEVECFKSTEFGLSDSKESEMDPLAGVDKQNVDVMMYCTGGIRCDVYSTILRQKGFKNLYTLRGGVAKYLKEEGASQWNGRLFVFDARLSVPPVFYHGSSVEATEISKNEDSTGPLASSARCLSCGVLVESVHRNCANIDCNKLYLSCRECVTQYRGCCCFQCMKAPRLRPVLRAEETYQRWHTYRDPPPPPPRPPGWISRRALKRRRRKERRQKLEKVSFPKIGSVTDVDCIVCLEAPAHLTQQSQ